MFGKNRKQKTLLLEDEDMFRLNYETNLLIESGNEIVQVVVQTNVCQGDFGVETITNFLVIYK